MSAVIFFDGHCLLCNRFIGFVIRSDRAKLFRFGYVSDLMRTFKDEQVDLPDSVVLLDNGKYYYKSDAVIRILQSLGGLFWLFTAGRFLPRPLRDRMYDWVASNRYNWFGRKESCLLPSADFNSRLYRENIKERASDC